MGPETEPVGTQDFVIVRSGAIARIRDCLAGQRETFLVDGFVFPGNSGGPVVLRTEMNAIEGTQPQHNAFLIGMVRSYVPYNEVAVSEQTHLPRVMFQENSGLAEVIPMDDIEKVIELVIQRQGVKYLISDAAAEKK